MSYVPRTFIVRGFNPCTADFLKPTGVIENVPNFVEKTVRQQFEAITVMLQGFKNMSSFSVQEGVDEGRLQSYYAQGSSDPFATEPVHAIFTVDIDVTLDFSGESIDEKRRLVKMLKPDIMETFKRWAEKSRVKNLRGWRASAVKTPIVEYDHENDLCHVRTQIITSNAIFYASPANGEVECNIASRDNSQIHADLANLRRKLTKVLGRYLDSVHYKHSLIGNGEIL